MRGFFAASTLVSSPKVGAGAGVARCGVCRLYSKCANPKLPISGAGRKRILIVLDSPTRSEDFTGKPVSGETGALLKAELSKVGVDLMRDCWVTYAINCHIPKGEEDSAQVLHCRPNVLKAVRELDPTVVLTFGFAAMRSLVGHTWREDVGELERWVGYQIPAQALNVWICPMWGLQRYMERKQKDKVLSIHFNKFLKAAVRKCSDKPWDVVPDWKSEVEIVYDSDVAAQRIRKCIELGGLTAFDYETNMLKPDWPEAEVWSASICWQGKKTFAYPWKGAAIEASREYLHSPLPKIASNLKFEDRWTRKFFGRPVRAWHWDTMVAAHVLDNRPGVTSIKFQSYVLLGMPCYNEHIEPFLESPKDKRVNRIAEIETRQLLLYNGLDSLLEYKAFEVQSKLMQLQEELLIK